MRRALLALLLLLPATAQAYPPADRVEDARRYLAARAGSNAFALVDSNGRLRGLNARRPYVSASVVKAMLLVAYLRAIERPPTAAERALLGPMITVSGNRRASAIYARVGDAGLLALARRAGMRDFASFGFWGSARITAADQARFFARIDGLVPRVSRAYARELLQSVDPTQRWGFARPALRQGFQVLMKAGWRRTAAGRLVHAVGLFERDDARVSLAVLTDANPSHAYGVATVQGIAGRIFAADGSPAHRRAGLVDVRRHAPGIQLDIRYATPNNITGAPLPGYCRPLALLLEPAARDLARVQRRLRRRGLGLKVFDAYRPVRATRALVRWARRSGRGHLVGTYIAERSRHNVGGAVDLTLVHGERQLAMGSAYDDLSPRAHTYHARGRALRNRLLLRRAMERFGFAPYDREWWHFEHRAATGARALDRPLGCG